MYEKSRLDSSKLSPKTKEREKSVIVIFIGMHALIIGIFLLACKVNAKQVVVREINPTFDLVEDRDLLVTGSYMTASVYCLLKVELIEGKRI